MRGARLTPSDGHRNKLSAPYPIDLIPHLMQGIPARGLLTRIFPG